MFVNGSRQGSTQCQWSERNQLFSKMYTLEQQMLEQQICDSVKAGELSYKVAGQLYVKAVEQDNTAYDRLSVRLGFGRIAFDLLVLVGENKLHPALLFRNTGGARALRKYNLKQQTEVLALRTLEVVAENSIVMLQLDELSARQVDQVFGPSGLRTPSEQRKYLKVRDALDAASIKRRCEQPATVIKSNGLLATRKYLVGIPELKRTLESFGFFVCYGEAELIAAVKKLGYAVSPFKK